MKQKSSKLKKLENSRYSILTNNLSECYVCKQTPVDIHEIYGGSNRQVSMKNGFCIPLCRQHHQQVTIDLTASQVLKSVCQEVYEETHSREDFIKLIGRNYL